ncbi:MAG: hypothetical protein KDH48_26275, partial [Rhodoferax sp.]|nr:hypothetical protein [Rhodoferax sp.]
MTIRHVQALLHQCFAQGFLFQRPAVVGVVHNQTMKFAGILTSIVLLSAVALGPAGTAWGQGADTSAA